MALTIAVFSRKQSARLAATLNSAPVTWIVHSRALRKGTTPGSSRWLSAPSATKSSAACGRMSSPYFTCARRLDAVVAEPALEGRERPGALHAHGAGELRVGRAGERLSAHVVDERAVDAHQRIGRDPRPHVVVSGSRLLGDERGQRRRVAREDVLLAGEQRRAAGDHPADRAELLARILGGEQTARSEDEATEGGQERLAGLAPADRGEERRLEGLQTLVDEVLLGREVVVDGLFGDLGRARDLDDGDGAEAALEEEPHGRVGDQLARAPLLELAKPCHGIGHSTKYTVTGIL